MCREGLEADEVLQATLVRLQHLCQLEAVLEQCLEVAQTPLPAFPSLRACLNFDPAAVRLAKVCSGRLLVLHSACSAHACMISMVLPSIPG